jgi:MSHA biogenesis protein MshO
MNIALALVRKRQTGFTLVEAIAVMVITGILAGIMVLFIRRPVQSYVDNAARADMGDVAELALRRMARELHTAVPNSIRLNGAGNLLEFIPTKAGGLYLAVEDNAGGNPLSFTNQAALSFDIVGPVPAAPYGIAVGDSIVVYNLGTGFQDADAYADSSADPGGNGNGNRASVTLVAGSTVSFVNPYRANNNPFANAAAAGRVPNSSPGHRFQVATPPVTFACRSNPVTGKGTLTRYWGYGFRAAQIDPSMLPANQVTSALMANNVAGCQFSVTAAANQHTGLIGMSISLARSTTGDNALEVVTLAHQVHVNNTP